VVEGGVEEVLGVGGAGSMLGGGRDRRGIDSGFWWRQIAWWRRVEEVQWHGRGRRERDRLGRLRSY
jgi:hypothetical protein